MLEELHELGLRVVLDAFGKNNAATVPTHQPRILFDDEDKKRVGTVLQVEMDGCICTKLTKNFPLLGCLVCRIVLRFLASVGPCILRVRSGYEGIAAGRAFEFNNDLGQAKICADSFNFGFVIVVVHRAAGELVAGDVCWFGRGIAS